jgi:hypothetical protein
MSVKYRQLRLRHIPLPSTLHASATCIRSSVTIFGQLLSCSPSSPPMFVSHAARVAAGAGLRVLWADQRAVETKAGVLSNDVNPSCLRIPCESSYRGEGGNESHAPCIFYRLCRVRHPGAYSSSTLANLRHDCQNPLPDTCW